MSIKEKKEIEDSVRKLKNVIKLKLAPISPLNISIPLSYMNTPENDPKSKKLPPLSLKGTPSRSLLIKKRIGRNPRKIETTQNDNRLKNSLAESPSRKSLVRLQKVRNSNIINLKSYKVNVYNIEAPAFKYKPRVSRNLQQ